MKAPESLAALLDYGIIQEVLAPLMSGKEAHIYVVVAGGEECVAKVYKEAHQRTFKHRSSYTEGRRTRNTRDQRAISKRTRHGRQKDEDAWRSTEVDTIYRLRDAGVRVPEPINFVDGVLVMEFVRDSGGRAAPRLGDLTFSAGEAHEIYLALIQEVVRMLSAGVIHGDLSDFNVLMSHDGPVLIDFPQSVDPTHNPNGRELLLRDVENLHRFLARFAPDEPQRPYGEEIWALFQENRLEPDSELTGGYRAPDDKADTAEVMTLIGDADREEEQRRTGWRTRDNDDPPEELEARGPVRAATFAPLRTVVDFKQESRPPATGRGGKKRRAGSPRGRRRAEGKASPTAASSTASGAKDEASPTRRRRRPDFGTRPGAAGERPERAARSKTLPAADAAKPSGARRRQRTRGNRKQAGAEGKQEGSKANAASEANEASKDASRRAAGRTRAQSEAKRLADPAPASGAAAAPREAGRTDRTRRRRRRRPRKSSPKGDGAGRPR